MGMRRWLGEGCDSQFRMAATSQTNWENISGIHEHVFAVSSVMEYVKVQINLQ
jgi:hypothetical protein